MSLQKYEALLKIVELGSLTKAAAALGYTQSGISHMLNALEKEWALTLLIRDRSGVQLTAEGEALLPMVRSLCNRQREIQEEVASLHGLTSGLIKAGTFTSVSVHWLPEIIKSFQQIYPNIDFELLHYGEYRKIEACIDDGRADCGFLMLPTQNPLLTMPLAQDRMMAILPMGHPLAQLPRCPVSAFAQEPYIQLFGEWDEDISAIFSRAGIKPNTKLTVEDDYAIIAMVESGLGISILPELVLHRTPYRVEKRELEPATNRRLAIATRREGWVSPATRRFMAHVAEEVPRLMGINSITKEDDPCTP